MDSQRIFVSKEFNIILQKFIKEFAEKNRIKLSTVQATDLICKKIHDAGGLKV